MQSQEEIKYLHSYMTTGSILLHVEGIYFKSSIEPLTFHVNHEFKQKLIKMASAAGLGQEEFLLQAVNNYMAALEKQN